MTPLFFLFMGVSTIFAILAGLAWGQLTLMIAVVALLLGAGVVARLAPKLKEGDKLKLEVWDQGIIFLLSIWVVLQFLYLIYESNGRLYFGNPNNLGDLPMHLNMLKSFARGLHFWPENLEWSGHKLRYPFAINVFSALFEILGVRTQAHLAVVGILCGFLLIRELWLLGGSFLLMAFFWSGGFKDLSGLWLGLGPWPMSGVEFKNLFLSVFMTQRGFLYALPVGAYVLRMFRRETALSKYEERVLIFFLAILPIFHLHSFLYLGLYLGLAHFFHPQRAQWLRIGAVAGVLALPWIGQMLLGGEQVSQALGWSPGWTYSANSELGIWKYFWINFAAFALLVPAVVVAAWRKRDFKIGVNLLLLLLFFTVRFAPWSWDNIKLLIWGYLVLCLDFYGCYLREKKTWQLGLGLLLFFPGFFQMLGSFPARLEAVSPTQDAYFLQCEEPGFEVNEAVLTSPDFDHPLLFSGVKMVMGFEAHVWSHGYNIEKRKAQIGSLLAEFSASPQQPPSWQAAAKELGAKWLYQSQNMPSIKQGLDPHLLERLQSRPACSSRPLRGDRIYDLSKIEPEAASVDSSPDADTGKSGTSPRPQEGSRK